MSRCRSTFCQFRLCSVSARKAAESVHRQPSSGQKTCLGVDLQLAARKLPAITRVIAELRRSWIKTSALRADVPAARAPGLRP
jgi:hypothetical protein